MTVRDQNPLLPFLFERNHVERAIAAAEFGQGVATEMFLCLQVIHSKRSDRRTAISCKQAGFAIHHKWQEGFNGRLCFVAIVRSVINLHCRCRDLLIEWKWDTPQG